MALRVLVAVGPLGLTLIVAWLLMEGHLSLGGGEKDIFLAVPLLLWSLLFLVFDLALWWRGATPARAATLAAVAATAALILSWVGLFVAVALRG